MRKTFMQSVVEGTREVKEGIVVFKGLKRESQGKWANREFGL